jgi:glutamine phosphoribosylpyrophosphate amidotransferase
MCGIIGFLSRRPTTAGPSTGRTVLTMLQALACRGPDSAGAAVIGPSDAADPDIWSVRVAHAPAGILDKIGGLGDVLEFGNDGASLDVDATIRFRFRPGAGVTPDDLERALDARRGGTEVLSLGRRLDLVKRVGAPDGLESAFGLSGWIGPLAIGHTRMSTESRIDLSHSQPFWVHGVPDLATVHNGHVTNYHQLRRRYEQQGTTFYTDNDSEVIGVYLRSRMERGASLLEAMAYSVHELDGAYSYIVASAEGLGIVRDRFGFKPMTVAETGDFVAAATEEIALRRALPGDYRVAEPPPGSTLFYPLGR